MRLWPRSLFGRLFGIAIVTTVAALAFAALAIGHVLERFVTRGLDQQLDAQVNVLARAVRKDGTLDQTRAISLPAFEDPGSGWGWRVDGAAGHWSRGTVILAMARPRSRRHREDAEEPREPRPYPGEARDVAGERVHFRQLTLPTRTGTVLLTAAGPRRVAIGPLREAMAPLLLSLAMLGGALALATVVQLRFGLRPLRRLRDDLGAVRAGQLRHVPTDQPAEIAPLAAELNALINQNEAGLAHARRHVSNLAHGLKTPLAALSVRLAESGHDLDGSLSQMVEQIDCRVRHHLGRARAAAPGGSQRARTWLAMAVADLVTALERIHAERSVDATVSIVPELAVGIDPQDLDEMVGNLLDNAWRHARSTVKVTARAMDGIVELAIEDDGPGLSEAAIGVALVPGQRLDERGDGHGFGLPIAQELAELNGGRLVLSRSAIGGLSAILALPVAS